MTAVLTAVASPGTWRRALPPLLLVLAALLLLYRDTAAAMVEIWSRSGTFAHAFLVVPIVLWLGWRSRDRLAPLKPAPAPVWLLPLAGCALLWLLGDLAIVNAATQLAFTAMLAISVPLLLGHAAARVLLFPLLFLFFAVPIGEFMMPQMIVWTADFTVIALRLSGVPVFREGEQLVIPTGTWSVVEACSGVRYLMASAMVGALFAYLNYRTLTRRLGFMLLALAVPIVANWLRAYLIVMIGHLSDNTLAVGVDHLIYGWVFFGFVIALLFAIGIRWAEAPVPAVSPPRQPVFPGPQPRLAVATAATLALMLAVAPHLALRLLDTRAAGAAPELATLGQQAPARYAALPAPVAAWTPAFLGASARVHLGWRDASGTTIDEVVGYWRDQSQGSKLVSSDNALGRGTDGWRQVAGGPRRITVDGRGTAVDEAVLRGPDAPGEPARLLVWQIYWINGTLTASEWQAKAWGAWHKLLGGGDDAAALVVSTPVADAADGVERARVVLGAFVQTRLMQLDGQLQRVRDGR